MGKEYEYLVGRGKRPLGRLRHRF